VGGDGKLPDGYPIAYVDQAALRSLLWHSKYDNLDRYFAQFQDAFDEDNKREYWIQDATDAFGSSESVLTPKLDAWVAAKPDSFAAHLARAAHWLNVAWTRRGTAWAKDTATADMASMGEALEKADADVTRALALRPELVQARGLRVDLFTLHGRLDEMRAEVDRATKVCPGCIRVRASYLAGSTPRWGGSYDQMHAFAKTCDPVRNARCKVLDGYVDYDLAGLAFIDNRLDDAEAAMNRALALGDFCFELLRVV